MKRAARRLGPALGPALVLALAAAGAGCRVEQDLGENPEAAATNDLSPVADIAAIDAAAPDAAANADADAKGNGGDGGGADSAMDAGPLVDAALGCDGGRLACGGECVDPQSNIKHCGQCNVKCTVGLEICLFAKCAPCVAGSNCNNTCTRISTDHDNCGSCGHACAMNQTCANGLCGP